MNNINTIRPTDCPESNRRVHYETSIIFESSFLNLTLGTALALLDEWLNRTRAPRPGLPPRLFTLGCKTPITRLFAVLSTNGRN